MKALIDADVLTYSIPFSLQEGYGEKAILKPDALRFMCARLDNAIENILGDSQCTDYECYLTGEGNFRCDVATIQPYKGGRASRPLLYEEARTYLASEHGAIIVNGWEADDQIAMDARLLGEDCVMCSIDKDLDNCPGNHYRWPIFRHEAVVTKSKSYYISDEEATYNFWTQMLVGDTVDKITGVPGIGKKRAEGLLSMLMDEATMCQVVYNEYFRVYNGTDIDPLQAMVENGTLLWLCNQCDENNKPVRFATAKGHLLDQLVNPDNSN